MYDSYSCFCSIGYHSTICIISTINVTKQGNPALWSLFLLENLLSVHVIYWLMHDHTLPMQLQRYSQNSMTSWFTCQLFITKRLPHNPLMNLTQGMQLGMVTIFYFLFYPMALWLFIILSHGTLKSESQYIITVLVLIGYNIIIMFHLKTQACPLFPGWYFIYI